MIRFLRVEEMPLADLVAFPDNARTGDVEAIRASVRRFGQYRSIVGRVQAGQPVVCLAGWHTSRAMLAEQLTAGRVELIECTDEEARGIVAADNRLPELAGYDQTKLAALVRPLGDDLAGTGWTAAALAEALAGPPAPLDPEPDDDGARDPAPSTVTAPGDLWELGGHRLLCGSATRREDVRAVLGGERACLMVTDPPYGVAYHAGKKGARPASIHGDLTQALIPLGFAVAVEAALDRDARVYVFGGTANWPMYSSLFDHHLRMQPRPMIWVKEGFVLHPTHYHSQHETVFFGWKGRGGGSSFWFGDRKGTDVWQVARDRDRVHPTQKPVEVCAIPVRNSAPRGGLVYDPFAGSGPVLVAAEQLGRRAALIEIDPVFCDAICRRFELLTGVTPVRVRGEATGPVPFAEVAGVGLGA